MPYFIRAWYSMSTSMFWCFLLYHHCDNGAHSETGCMCFTALLGGVSPVCMTCPQTLRTHCVVDGTSTLITVDGKHWRPLTQTKLSFFCFASVFLSFFKKFWPKSSGNVFTSCHPCGGTGSGLCFTITRSAGHPGTIWGVDEGLLFQLLVSRTRYSMT